MKGVRPVHGRGGNLEDIHHVLRQIALPASRLLLSLIRCGFLTVHEIFSARSSLHLFQLFFPFGEFLLDPHASFLGAFCFSAHNLPFIVKREKIELCSDLFVGVV